MTPKPCDDKFAQAESALRKAADKMQGAAVECVRQAGHELARACRVFRDPDASALGDALIENLRGKGDLANVREACHLFATPRRATANHRDPAPEDLLVFSAMYLQDACENFLSGDFIGLMSVGADTVRSRISSEKILLVLHAR
jgi:hypothetical protein